MEEINNQNIDFLTKCFARSSLIHLLGKVLIESKLGNWPLSIAMIDLDRFKYMNDKYGHTFGDEALKYFSSSLRLCLNFDYQDTTAQIFIFRYGGDEFVMVFPGKTSQEVYKTILRVLRNIKTRHFLFKGKQFQMSFSTGIVVYPDNGTTVNELLEKVDKALYFSKKSRRGKITQYNRIKRQALIQKIRLASVMIFITLLIMAINQKRDILNSFSALFKIRAQAKVKMPRLKSVKADKIYLKSGHAIRGIITDKDSDPMEVKMILDQGEGVILLRKSEISKIEPDTDK